MVRVTFLIAVLIGLAAAPVRAQDGGGEGLVMMFLADWTAYDARCMVDDSDEAWRACGARDYVGYLLGFAGWCWGQEGQQIEHMDWHECVSGVSFRPERP